MATVTIYQEFKPGYTTGKETERLTFPTIKDAFAYCLQERKKVWDDRRARLGWWEIKDKREFLPNDGQFRRWAEITK